MVRVQVLLRGLSQVATSTLTATAVQQMNAVAAARVTLAAAALKLRVHLCSLNSSASVLTQLFGVLDVLACNML
jgi:hypothetical protein